MFINFIKHSVKSFLRNAAFDLKLFLKVLFAISLLYLFLALIYLGYDFENVIQLYQSSSDPVTLFNHNLLHICTVLFILQVFSLKNPLSALLAYLHLPVKRNKLVLYILLMSVSNYFFIGLLLFFVPYSITTILPDYSTQQFLFYFTGILIIFFSVGYFSLLIRNLIGISFVYVILPVLLFAGLYFIDLFLDISFTGMSAFIFEQLINKNLYFLILLVLILTGLLLCNFILLKKGFYRIYQNQKTLLNYPVSPCSHYFRENALFPYAILEIRLIARNRRPRGFFWIAVFFLVMFCMIIPRADKDLYLTFLVYILISGMFGYSFIQFLFSWESSYFDFISSAKFDIIKYLKAKYLIYIILSLIVFIIYLLVVKPAKAEIHMFFSALLYNSGLGYFVLIFMASYNKSRIDLNRNIFFNYQGINSVQFLGVILIMLIPCLILFLLLLRVNLTHSLLIINFLCIVALINQKKIWKIIHNKLSQRKYTNLDGYRK